MLMKKTTSCQRRRQMIWGYIRDTGMPVLDRARSFGVTIFYITHLQQCSKEVPRQEKRVGREGSAQHKTEPSNSHITYYLHRYTIYGDVSQRDIHIRYEAFYIQYKQGSHAETYSLSSHTSAYSTTLQLRDTITPHGTSETAFSIPQVTAKGEMPHHGKRQLPQCVVHNEPYFQPVDIQHTQCSC